MITASDVTVVMCTRDGRSKGHFDAAVRSVLDQSSPPGELIVVDDASTDGTAEYARRAYPHLRVVANQRTGLAAGRNTGIGLARGTWIAFIDDDDVWRPAKLARQFAQIGASARPDWTLWASRIVSVDGEGRPAGRSAWMGHLARWPLCLVACPIAPSGVVAARTLFERFGAFSEALSDGSAFEYWTRCLAGGVGIVFTDDVQVELCRHARQMSRRHRTPEWRIANDAIVMPFLSRLPALQAERVRTARALIGWRSLLIHSGPRAAARYWQATPLRPARMDRRGTLFALLDTAAARLPAGLQARLRDLASRTVA